jgi:TPR repeat protein
MGTTRTRRGSEIALLVATLVACGPPAARDPDPGGPLSVRSSAPEGDVEVIRIEPISGWRVGYDGNEHAAGSLLLPADRWARIDFENEDPGRAHTLHVPSLGWTVPLAPGAHVTRWVRASAGLDATSECVEAYEYDPSAFQLHITAVDDWDARMRALHAAPDGLSEALWGDQLFGELGCTGCHVAGGYSSDLSTLWGSSRERAGARVVLEGEEGRAYLRGLLADPTSFGAPVMPRYRVMDEESNALAAYLESLHPVAPPPLPIVSDVPELPSLPPRARGVVRFLAESCDDATPPHPRECWLLGVAYERGEGVTADLVHARQLYARTCTAADGHGCESLARLDAEHALTHLTMGCERGRAPSCRALAERDAAGAGEHRLRACSLGDYDACVPAVRILDDATPRAPGTPTEESRLAAGVDETVRGVAQRCDRNMAGMCAWLALQYSYENDMGLPMDAAHALELAERACNDRAVIGCEKVGQLLLMSQREPERAGAVLDRSCAAGNSGACSALALLMGRLPEMRDLAGTYRLEACVLGSAEDCAAP